MNRYLNIAIIFVGSLLGGVFAQPAAGFFNKAYAYVFLTPANLNMTTLAPVGIVATMTVNSNGLGDNSTFKGVSNAYFSANDDPSVTTGTKGVLYGAQFSVRPLLPRTNSPYDDAGGVIVQNQSPNGSQGTEAIYIGHNAGFTGGAKEWADAAAIGSDANGDIWGYGTGTYRVGLDLCRNVSVCATITGAPISSPLITPSSSSATCSQGWMAWDAGFVYVCTAANTWKRATLATF